MGEFYNPDKLYKGGSRNNSLINKKMIFMGHRTKRFFQWSGKMGERF